MTARWLTWIAWAALASSSPAAALSATHYFVRLEPAGLDGTVQTLALDFVSSDSVANLVTIEGFAHDGTPDSSSVEGGPVVGPLGAGSDPGGTSSLFDQFFLNRIEVPFSSFGTQVTFGLTIDENAPTAEGFADEFSLYLLAGQSGSPHPSADPLGCNALVALDVSGESGGDLHVFAPMTFIPPDTLFLGNLSVDVFSGSPATGRLSLVRAVPNPSRGSVQLQYEVPRPGGRLRLRILDVAGRVVAEPLNRTLPPGVGSAAWNGRDVRDQAAPPGMYIAQLTLGGESLVHKIILAR